MDCLTTAPRILTKKGDTDLDEEISQAETVIKMTLNYTAGY